MGMRVLIEVDPGLEIVGEASTVAEALAAIPSIRPDVAVVDVRLPDGDGVEICRAIRSQSPETACLIFTSHADVGTLSSAIVAGAAGYVLKDAGGYALPEAIRRVGSGESLLDQNARTGVREPLRSGSDGDGSVDTLVRRDEQIWEMVPAGHAGRSSAVRGHVSGLLAKLGRNR